MQPPELVAVDPDETGVPYSAFEQKVMLDDHQDGRDPEALLLSVLGLTLFVAGVAAELNVSAAVGAFLVGIALSGHAAEAAQPLLAPLRDLFAAVFFVFFGLQTDPGSIPPVALAAGALALVTAATKVATGWWAARRAGVRARGRWRAGAVLVARGEFSIVIAGLAVAAGEEPTLGPLAAGVRPGPGGGSRTPRVRRTDRPRTPTWWPGLRSGGRRGRAPGTGVRVGWRGRIARVGHGAPCASKRRVPAYPQAARFTCLPCLLRVAARSR